MNSVFIEGNLTKNPELKEFANNKVAKFSIAVNGGKRKDGTKDVAFLDCTAWDQSADIVMELQKGDGVLLNAYIKQENWESKEGQKRSKLVFNAQRILKLAKRARKDDDTGPAPTDLSTPDENVPF